MTAGEAIKAASKAHTIYKTTGGTRVPSVTTILGVLGKPWLLDWAWNLGREGIEMKGYVDRLAGIGTLVHAMILEDLSGGERRADRDQFSADQNSLADNSFLSYLEWKRGLSSIEPCLLEHKIISERHRFGGTFDFYGRVNGEYTLIDFKTSKGVYTEHFIQLAAYDIALRENLPTMPTEYLSPQRIAVLNVPRTEDEAFLFKSVGMADIKTLAEIFLRANDIYQLKKGVSI